MASSIQSPHAAVLTADDLLRVRMRGLGLAEAPLQHTDGGASPGVERVVAVVDQLFALQGQDWRASQWAIGVRDPLISRRDVMSSLDAGLIVRSWPMRGTVHLISAKDIGWVQRLTNTRVLAGAAKRRTFLGMNDEVLDQITEVTVQALTGGLSLGRDELGTIWSEAGIEWRPNWRYHLVWWLCQTGVTTFGPVTTDPNHPAASATTLEPRLVLASEWIRSPRTLTGDDALVEFASRYVRGRGAIIQKDLANWSMLSAADVKRALTLAHEDGRIVRVQRAGVTGAAGALWADPHALDAAPHEPEAVSPVWHLLPAFDEHLLGYSNREPQLAAEHLSHIVPGRNGVFQATVVCDGRVVATWRKDPKTGTVSTIPLPDASVDTAALQPAFAQLTRFYG